MLQNKRIFVLVLMCFSLMMNLFSQTETTASEEPSALNTDLAERYLQKAETAFDDGKTEDAVKSITMAMKLTKTNEYDVIPANIIVFARTIYRTRLKQLQKKYDEANYIELKTNLETYSEVQTAEITKLMRQIEADLLAQEKEATKKNQQEFYDKIQESNDTTSTAIQKTGSAVEQMIAENKETEAKRDEREAVRQQREDEREAKRDEREAKRDARDEKNDKKFNMIFLVIVGIALTILFVVLLIVFIVRAAARHSQMQQAQYAEAFKLLAQNQSQTNRLMIGGIAGLYSEDGLKLAGSSTWSQSALPPPEETPEEKEELNNLAAKCQDLGAKIDEVTGRKNNSKNVSELVFKLAMQLGVPQHEAMVYFCASMVYDAGFLDVDQDLLQAENLTDEQRKELNKHVAMGESHLQFVPKRYWSIFEEAANSHHENMDGSGMPKGLKGEEIPRIARIIRVADSFNALSSKRSFRGGIDKDSAVEKLEEQSNIYDPDVINALKEII